MGFFARLKLGEHFGKKTRKGSSNLNSLPVEKEQQQQQQQQQHDDASIHFIYALPASKTPSVTDVVSISSTHRKLKSRPTTPSILSGQEMDIQRIVTTGHQSDSHRDISLHRHNNLISSSLITPRTPNTLKNHRNQYQVENEEREDLRSSPPADRRIQDTPGEVHLYDVDPSTPSKGAGGAGQMFRRASGKVVEYTLSRSNSRSADRYDDFLETIGRSLPSASSVSVATHVSGRSYTEPSNSSTASMKKVWRRSKIISTSPSAQGDSSLSSCATFPGSNTSNDGQLNDVSTDALDNGDVAVQRRWRKTSKKSLRPSSSNNVDFNSIQLYMLRLSPPPRGLATIEMEGRKNLVCQYVQERLSKEKRKMAKPSFKRPTTATTSNVTTLSAEECIQTLEDDFHQFMVEDIKQDTDAQMYKELNLANIFIEARRYLGIDSMSLRLHTLFDITETQLPRSSASESNREVYETEATSHSSPPPSAWDNGQRVQNSLSPAPRRRRRPKTTPTSRAPIDDLSHDMEPSPYLKSNIDSNRSLDSSVDMSSKASHQYRHQIPECPNLWSKEVEGIDNYSSVSFPISQDSISLPPSPPKSVDSHCYAEVTPYATAKTTNASHYRVISEVLAL